LKLLTNAQPQQKCVRSPKLEGNVKSQNKNEQWYALQVRPHFERIVARHLQRKGYSEYLPLYKTRRGSDRMKEIDLPLFSGYTFCKFDVEQKLPILVAPGVLSIVGIGRTPTPISDKEIASIERIVQSGLQYEPWPFTKVGQVGAVARGPLAGIEGIVVEVKTTLRLVVSLPLLQRSVGVNIERDCLEPMQLAQAVGFIR
jgi:transcriptional antiterminator NusG